MNLNDFPKNSRIIIEKYLLPSTEGNAEVSQLTLHLYMQVSRILCFNRVMIETKEDLQDFPMLYGMLFAPSGSYKDSPQSALSRICEKVTYLQDETKKSRNARMYARLVMQANLLPDAKSRREFMEENRIYLWEEYCAGGTYQGLQESRISCMDYKIGSMHFTHGEIIDALKGGEPKILETLSKIKDITLQGVSLTDTLKSRHTRHVKGVPQTFLVHGSIAELYKENGLLERVMGVLATGFARRNFILFSNKNSRSQVTREQERGFEQTMRDYKEEIQTIFEEIYLKSKPAIFEGHKGEEDSFVYKTIKIGEEVRDMINAYKNSCYARAAKIMNNSQKIELHERDQKAIRLSACIAMLEHPKEMEIKLEDYDFAIKICDKWGEEFFRFLKNREDTIPEMLIKKIREQKLLDEPNFSKTNLREMLPSNQRAGNFINTYIEQMHEKLAETEEVLVVIKGKHGKTEYYDIENMPTHEDCKDDLIVKYSYAKTKELTDTSALPSQIEFSRFHEVTGWDTRYLPAYFTPQERATENYVPGHNLVVLDIDNDKGVELKMARAKEMFKDFRCMICTTKRHNTEEKGNVDRFRIIFPTKEFDFKDDARFKRIMHNLIIELGLEKYADIPAAGKIALSYACHKGEHWYSAGEKLLNWRVFDYREAESKKAFTPHATFKENVIENLQFKTKEGLKGWEAFEHVKEGSPVPCNCILPGHNDTNASAFIARHNNGNLFFSCVVCDQTFFNK